VVVCKRCVDALIPKLVDVGGSGLAPCGVTASNRWKPHDSTSIQGQTRQARSDSYTLPAEHSISRQLVLLPADSPKLE
jgi:hypothetical protein